MCAGTEAINRRKFWMAYQNDPEGKIWVDAGAARALRETGGSLLPGGVCGVEGTFGGDALVRVLCKDAPGQYLGVGLCRYASATLREIMGLKRHEIAAKLGIAEYPAAIHRDELLLDAAV